MHWAETVLGILALVLGLLDSGPLFPYSLFINGKGAPAGTLIDGREIAAQLPVQVPRTYDFTQRAMICFDAVWNVLLLDKVSSEEHERIWRSRNVA